MIKTKFKPRKSLRWFVDRVGRYVFKNASADLFNPPIEVLNEQHAKALHASQDKGNRFT